MNNNSLFTDSIEYLQEGGAFQQYCYKTLISLNILNDLSAYEPVLVGTIPIGLNIEGSDADIACCSDELDAFKEFIILKYGSLPGFSDRLTEKVYVASFQYNSLPIEIYAENRRAIEQNGYRHMLVEWRLLNLAGEKFREEIIRLKREGYKTEPAFGRLLHLDEPYSQLLLLSDKADSDLLKLIPSKYRL